MGRRPYTDAQRKAATKIHRENEKVYRRAQRARLRALAGKPPMRELPLRIEIPQEVEAEWRRCLMHPAASVTAALMGDPLPGRSALDRVMVCED